MKENEILGNNEEHPEHYEVLSGSSLLISRSGKNRKTEVITRENKYKKRPYVTRMCVLHKVVDFAIFLGSLRISIFTLLEEIENERGYPEINEYYEVKPNILKRAIPRILLFSQYFSFSLNSARIFFFLALSFFLSFSQSPCRVLWQYENKLGIARFSLFLPLFLRSLL